MARAAVTTGTPRVYHHIILVTTVIYLCLLVSQADAVGLALGVQHTCYSRGGRIQCFGTGPQGQLGSDATGASGLASGVTSITFSDTNPSIEVVSGSRHVCALFGGILERRIRCWGLNDYGQLGQGSTTNHADGTGPNANTIPYVDLPLSQDSIVAIAAGGTHTCVLFTVLDPTAPSNMRCFGRGDQEALGHPLLTGDHIGDDTNEVSQLPYLDFGGGQQQVLQMSVGGSHTCALFTLGVKCWGDSTYGQTGQGTGVTIGRGVETYEPSRRRRRRPESRRRRRPQQYTGATLSTIPYIPFANDGAKPTLVTAGDDHTCVLFSIGKIRCFGRGQYGAIGNETTNDVGNNPGDIEQLPYLTFIDPIAASGVSAGGSHTCAVFLAGGVRCWGRNNAGQLGINAATATIGTGAGEMAAIGYISWQLVREVVEVVAGFEHTCALFEDNLVLSYRRIRCWGNGASGQLGDNNASPSAPNVGDAADEMSNIPYVALNIEGQPIDIFSVTPTGGISTGGGTLTLRGAPLHISRAIVVRFVDDSTSPPLTLTLSATILTADAISVNIPSWEMGTRKEVTVKLYISVNGITYVNTHETYRYLSSETVTASSKSVSLSPTPIWFTSAEDIPYITEPVLCRIRSSASAVVVNRATITTTTRIDCGSSPLAPAPYVGSLELSVTAGAAWTSYPLQFTGVTVTGISPTRGPVEGSGKIQVIGTAFVNTGDTIIIRFSDGQNDPLTQTGTFVSATLIEGTTPSLVTLLSQIPTPHTMKVSVSINNGVEYTDAGDYLFYVVPTVVAVQPPGCPTGGSPSITVVGSNFANVGGFFLQFSNGTAFQTAPGTLTADGTSLVTAAPAFDGGGTGAIEASYNGIDFTNNLVSFSYHETMALEPPGGPVSGGTIVRVVGVGFLKLTSARCKFGSGAPVIATVLSSTVLTCSSPPGTAGPVPLEISINGNDYSTDNKMYRYYDPPQITSMAPLSGPSTAGRTQKVTLFGTGFTSLGVAMSCQVGAKTGAAELVVDGAGSHVTCIVKDGSSTLPLLLAQNGQNFEATGMSYAYYDYFLLNPPNGPTSGGTTVVLTGTGFKPAAGARCKFGNTVVDAKIISSVKMLCVSPRASSGGTTVEYSADENSYTAAAQTFEYYASPFVTAISPLSAPDSGSVPLTVFGSSFRDTGTLKVRVGRTVVPAIAASVSGQIRLTATVPPGVGQQNVEISQNNGITFTDNRVALTYNSIAKVEPSWGPTTGGTQVQVTGQGFLQTTGAKCKFGSLFTTHAFVTTAEIASCTTNKTVKIPPGPVSVYTTTNGKDYTTSSTTFTFYQLPNITRMDPQAGPGDPKGDLLWLDIYGSGFIDTGILRVNFGSSISPKVVVNSTTRVRCLIPPGAGTVQVSFSMNSADFQTVGTFSYFTVTTITPTLGPSSGGTSVSVTGTGFTSASGLSCRVNGTVVSATFVNPLLVVCQAPSRSVPITARRLLSVSDTLISRSWNHYPHQPFRVKQANATAPVIDHGAPTSSFEVEVSTNGRDFTAPPKATGTYSYYNPPTVTALIPDRGETAGMTLVTVVGSGFVNTTELRCRFKATSVEAEYINQTTIACNSSVNAVETVNVAVSMNLFDYHIGPSYAYEACQPGWYAKDFQTPCTKCENATFASLVGSVSCKLCQSTEYTLNVGSFQCQTCPENTHIPTADRDSIYKCQCRPGFYHPEALRGQPCLPCPEGAECTGDINPPLSQNEHWHHPDFPYIHMKCDNPQACPGGGFESCSTGYAGRLCSRCAKGYYAQGRFCEVCPKLAVWILVAFVIFSTLAAALLVKMVGKEASAFGATLSIATFFFQTLSMLNQLQLTWPNLVRRLVNIFTGPFNLNIDILALECSFPVSYRSKWASTMMMPFGFMALFAAFFAIGYIEEVYKRNKLLEKIAAAEENSDAESLLGSDDESIPEPTEENPYGLGRKALMRLFGLKNRLINAYILFLVLAYVVLVTTSVSILDCTTRKDGISTLDIFPALSCYESWWWFFAPMAVVTSFAYGIALPVGFAILLHINRRRLLTPEFLDRFGSVYSEYKPELAWWESAIMLQKISLILPLMFLTIYKEVQIIAFLFFLFLGLLINLSNRPFFVERYNNLQTFLRWCAVVMLMCGVMFNEGKYPHPAIEPVLTIICFSALLLGCLACLHVIWKDLMITKVDLRRNVPPEQLEFLHVLMHPHGKTEVLQWLGCDRTAGRNFQGEFSSILADVAEEYEKRDLFAEVELNGFDQFLHIYTGGVFLTPVVPFVREWLLQRLPLNGNVDAAHPKAVQDVSMFVDCFSELNNWRRQMHMLAAQRHEKSEHESDGVISLTDHERILGDDYLSLVLKTLFVGVITPETQDFIVERMSQADYMCLDYLVLAVTNLKTMANAVLLEPTFYQHDITEKEKWERRLILEEVQPLIPVLHILYQETFTDEAMSALADQIESFEVKSSDGFSLAQRSPAYLLHQLFVSTRELKGEYDILNRLKAEYVEKIAETKKDEGLLNNITNRIGGFFGFNTRNKARPNPDEEESVEEEEEERKGSGAGFLSSMASKLTGAVYTASGSRLPDLEAADEYDGEEGLEMAELGSRDSLSGSDVDFDGIPNDTDMPPDLIDMKGDSDSASDGTYADRGEGHIERKPSMMGWMTDLVTSGINEGMRVVGVAQREPSPPTVQDDLPPLDSDRDSSSGSEKQD